MPIDPKGYYRDQSKRDRTPYWGQVQRWVFKAKTKEEWMEAFDKLSPKEQYDVLRAYTPVPKEVKVDGETKIELIINGIRQIKSIDNHAVASLDEHDPAVDNSDD